MKAYPTRHSWIVSAHISLGDIQKQVRSFNRQRNNALDTIQRLDGHPALSPALLTGLKIELLNINNMYESYEPAIATATQILATLPTEEDIAQYPEEYQQSDRHKRSALPFLGDALSWLTGTATTKDTKAIKRRINDIIERQNMQQSTLVHIVSIINVTRYETKVNRQRINDITDSLFQLDQGVSYLTNFTINLYSRIEMNRILLHYRNVLSTLRDCLNYLKESANHVTAYINTATTGLLTPEVLPLPQLQEILQQIEDKIPSNMGLPISSSDTLHAYRYIRTHMLAAASEFILLIDIPIQDRSQQYQLYQVINLPVPQRNTTAKYAIDTKFVAVSYNEDSLIPVTPAQFEQCLKANGQFCHLPAPAHPLMRPPSCIASLYSKHQSAIEQHCTITFSATPVVPEPIQVNKKLWILTTTQHMQPNPISLICPHKSPSTIEPKIPFHFLHLPPACRVTTRFFHIPAHYEDETSTVNISIVSANIRSTNITANDFRIWQHFTTPNISTKHLDNLEDIPEVPLADLYRKMADPVAPQPFILPAQQSTTTFVHWQTIIIVTAIVLALLISFTVTTVLIGRFVCNRRSPHPVGHLMDANLDGPLEDYNLYDDGQEWIALQANENSPAMIRQTSQESHRQSRMPRATQTPTRSTCRLKEGVSPPAVSPRYDIQPISKDHVETHSAVPSEQA